MFVHYSIFIDLLKQHLSNLVLFVCHVTREIVIDPDSSRLYDIMLFKIDVRHGPYGMYNFYKMQV